MEHSSPLAAMQPPSLPIPWTFRTDLGRPSSLFDDGGGATFNFKDVGMQAPSSDYFSSKPIRGSSPTASLAADLSQNFHIDRSSPQLVTPRRSLFTSVLDGAMVGREMMTTPPLPSSSPGPGFDSMDISPLPHKAPMAAISAAAAAFEDASPTSTSPATDRSTSTQMPSSSDRHLTVPTVVGKTLVPERRRPSGAGRPSLARAKGHSTGAIPFAAAAAAAAAAIRRPGPELHRPLPAFTFGGAVAVRPSSASTDSTDPARRRGPSSPPPLGRMTTRPTATNPIPARLDPPINLVGPARPRLSFSSVVGHHRHAPPLSGHIRKASGPIGRPRKLCRRSLSMFEHGDEIKEESPRPVQAVVLPRPVLSAIMDVDGDSSGSNPAPPPSMDLRLPHFIPDDRPDGLPRISSDTLIDVLDGRYARHYDDVIVIDCRFEYEYDGGHVDGALNFNDKERLARRLFGDSHPRPPSTLLVFHCEYSAHRAPLMAEFIRGHDRTTNDHRYPILTYPDVYILDGGYSAFFRNHRIRCVPPSYVEMHAKEHADTCEREMGKLRHRKKLSRAQTFAFGQHPMQADDSPTAPGRFASDTMMHSTFADQRRRAQAHRLPSY